MTKSLYQSRSPQEWQQFLALLGEAVAENRLDDFCALFFTPDERESLGLRVQIVQALLNHQSSQREIQQMLNTSAATITRGSNMLKTLDSDFIQWINGKLNGKEA